MQDMMKVRLQEAMPDVPLQVLRERREIQENEGAESDDEERQIHESQGPEFNDELENDGDTNEAGAAAGIEVQYDEENDVTFQSNITETNGTEQQSRFSRFKRLKNKFRRRRFGMRRCNVSHLADGTLDITVEEEYDVQHGEDIDSESDSDGDYQEGIPLVRLRHSDW